jgi:hypothetical protein
MATSWQEVIAELATECRALAEDLEKLADSRVSERRTTADLDIIRLREKFQERLLPRLAAKIDSGNSERLVSLRDAIKLLIEDGTEIPTPLWGAKFKQIARDLEYISEITADAPCGSLTFNNSTVGAVAVGEGAKATGALHHYKVGHGRTEQSTTESNPARERVGISYVVINGNAGIHELNKGQDSEVFGSRKYNYRIIRNSVLKWAVELDELYSPWDIVPPVLDWGRLRKLGAPIDPLAPKFKLRDVLDRHHQSNKIIIDSDPEWIELNDHNCPGIDPVRALADLDPSLKNRNKWIAGLRNWIFTHAETTRDSDGEIHALLPTIQVREPMLYCLKIEVDSFQNAILRIRSAGHEPVTLALDHRAVLLPLGCIPDLDTRAEKIDRRVENRINCALLDGCENGKETLSDIELGTWTVSTESGFIEERAVGPFLSVESVQVYEPHTLATFDAKLRLPNRTLEHLDCWFFGASCPEIFYRTNSGPWQYYGSVLRGAIGPRRARRERHEVSIASANGFFELLILEVPGEYAVISTLVTVQNAGRKHCFGHHDRFHLECGGRLHYKVVPPFDGRIVLDIEGFFEALNLSTTISR